MENRNEYSRHPVLEGFKVTIKKTNYLHMKIKYILLAFVLFIGHQLHAKEFNILDFGAITGKLSTSAVQKAVDACFSAGGGKVTVPAGTFVTGSVILKSNVNLYLENGAELLGSENILDYKIGNETHGIIFAEDAINLTISGTGTINGNGTHFYDSTKNHVYDEFDTNRTRQKGNYMPE